MRYLYLGCRRNLNFTRAINRELGGKRALILDRYGRVPRDISTFTGVILVGRQVRVFQKRRNFDSFASEVSGECKPFLWLAWDERDTYLNHSLDKFDEVIYTRGKSVREVGRDVLDAINFADPTIYARV